METPAAIWGVLAAAILAAGARCEVIAVGYRLYPGAAVVNEISRVGQREEQN
jgi:hypothetical protein